jgi:formylglycine-generating enzyme required for sulfatase activity
MVWVPGGVFQMGDELEPGELPVRQVETPGFWMDRTEVTNAQFSRFVQATGYVTDAERAQQSTLTQKGLGGGTVLVFSRPDAVLGRDDTSQWWVLSHEATWRHPAGPGSSIEGRDAYPVVAVTYADASAYAQWLGRTLPSEVQWERAARSAKERGDSGANTWQGVFPVLDAGTDGHAGIAPVGCYPGNALGIHDLIGNVWEITQDAYRGSGLFNTPMALPATPSGLMSRLTSPGSTPGAHVIKGGSFLCSEDYCSRARAGSRQPLEDGMAASHIGFRTVTVDAGPHSELGTGKSVLAVAQ